MRAITGFDVEAAPCDIPSLFIYGTQFDYVTPKTTPAILKHFLKSRLAAIEGAGHWLHAQEPQRFIQTFREFADALEFSLCREGPHNSVNLMFLEGRGNGPPGIPRLPAMPAVLSR